MHQASEGVKIWTRPSESSYNIRIRVRKANTISRNQNKMNFFNIRRATKKNHTVFSFGEFNDKFYFEKNNGDKCCIIMSSIEIILFIS